MAVIPFPRGAGPTPEDESVAIPHTPRPAWAGVPMAILAEIAQLLAENAALRRRLVVLDAQQRQMETVLAELVRVWPR